MSTKQKLMKHFSSIMNVCDFVQYMTTLMLVITNLIDAQWPSVESCRIIGAFLVFILWFKMFDWLRMFDATSFYIALIN